jgi:hypothetical protein
VFPTLLERDFNIPPADELLAEVNRIVEKQEHQRENATPDELRKHA